MRSGTTYIAVSSVNSKKRPDYFQRKKVGSIRDNPKLLKIRQQFENASLEDLPRTKSTSKEAESAPTSFSLSRNSSTLILDNLLKGNSKFDSKTETFLQRNLGAIQNRRCSEGDIKERKSFSVVSYENSPCSTPSEYKPFTISNTKADNLSSSSKVTIQKDAYDKNYNSSRTSSSESGIHTNSSASEEDNSPVHLKLLRSPDVNYDANKFFTNANEKTPPIPRRRITPVVANSFIQSNLNRNRKSQPPSPSVSDKTNVQKAIQMYEGMSSTDLKKIIGGKSLLKRDDSTSSRRSFIHRKHSRRNSMRKSKQTGDKEDPSWRSPAKRKDASPKNDDGVGCLNTDDGLERIYQTLTNTVNISPDLFDPYDRLNRLHDVVNMVHKGQSSNCAACKAIPSSVLQYRTNEASFMQVKCNELAPHHHPPCICFACQHSIFSCCISSTAPPIDTNNDANIYYNLCYLNSPSWRQSRRRPVCEQNGRLCIVNCDMEKCSSMCASTKKSGELYEKSSNCKATPKEIPQQKNSTKHVSDSCDSDEGWVDITDSEDEKSLVSSKQNLASKSSDSSGRPQENLVNDGYDICQLVRKCMDLDLTRALSTEHLYESISELESQLDEEDETLPKEHISNSSQDSSIVSIKGELNPENELDSGEWSTESASPTFDESSNKDTKNSTMNQYRFMVNYESQETAKKTFMNSVLGRKVVNPKKRRMSNFFVPWLVSNEYGSSSNKSPKGTLKKQNSRGNGKSVPCKNKRSRSVPNGSPKLSLSCTKTISSSSEILEEGDEKEIKDGERLTNKYSENNSLLLPSSSHLTSSKESLASSGYLRADQLQFSEPAKSNRAPAQNGGVVDVSVERVHKRSLSGNSDHSYILFETVKEEDVPLYQFYERNIKERVSFCRSPKSLSPIMWSAAPDSGHCSDSAARSPVSQLSVVEQLSPDAQDMKMLWCELPEVKDSGILERISAQELKLQEAIFEFIQSQASYIRSLKVLYENFIRTSEFSDFESSSCVLSKHEHDVLFSDIIRVKENSERLLCELTARWSDGILIPDVCDIIHHHAILPTFSVYVRYCSNRVYQERTLKELKETRMCFLEVLRKLEINPVCQGLSLESFLFLPMQHISRLPLLLDNIFRWLVPDSPSYGICKSALEAVHKTFMQCNEGARKMERLEEMFVLNKQLEFKECKVIPLISASRWLLKKGELVKLEFDKKTFGRSNRCVRVPIYIFLFNDLLVVTKKKNDDSYSVVDYCLRDKVQAMPVNAKELQQPVVVPNTCRYLIYLTLFNNHQGSAVDMILNCALLSERTRWIEAINCVPQNKPCEVWEYDCPQVQCVRSYIAQQPDELSLQESDVVTIHRKMNDGWYEGRRLRDGLQGWFPASYTMDIPCSRARASNLRQCYRLLMLSQKQ
ncbi:hypothetical protein JTE90_017526 [Oedothorax gibbosus]|uniref:Rho guanine nucleotide exchange factor 26 n=1 Tax=Oedothorax gibbosus TaxID=931172 RepID=A0AAV6UBQ7_9ARAC|nr:hypothetical protein JTE90_017526 [Oedothorax gibbosus]